jgi:GntR family transcriptional regulator
MEVLVQLVAMKRVADQAYRLIADSLRRGVYPPGSRLPGERDLSEQLGVSRSTLREALERLADEELLTRSAQRGWFVPRQVVGEPPSTLQSFTEMVRSRGLVPTTRMLSRASGRATLAQAEQLGVAPASPVLTLTRLRGMNGTPVCVDVSVLPLPLAAPLAEAELDGESLYERLDVLCGIRIGRSAYSVQAEAADAELAQLLDIPAGSPVLLAEEIAYTADGAPVLIGVNRYRGDAYRFEADLYRSIDPV